MIAPGSESSSLNGLPPDIALIQAFAQLSATVLDLDDLLTSGLDMLSQTFAYELLAVLLVDNESDKLVLKAWKAAPVFESPDYLEQLVSEVIETGTTFKKEDLVDQRDDAPVGACIAVPLLIGRLVIGALVVACDEPYHFPTTEEQLLTIFASQLTVAITSAQLYKRSREQQQQEFIRRQIATHLQRLSTIINATLDLDEVLRLILEHIEVVIPYKSALIMLLHGQDLVVRAASGFAEAVKPGLAMALSPSGFYHPILVHQYPAVFHDVTQKTFWAFERFPAMDHVRAWIGAPLVIKNQVTGILTLHHQEPGYFDQGRRCSCGGRCRGCGHGCGSGGGYFDSGRGGPAGDDRNVVASGRDRPLRKWRGCGCRRGGRGSAGSGGRRRRRCAGFQSGSRRTGGGRRGGCRAREPRINDDPERSERCGGGRGCRTRTGVRPRYGR
jgi:GAF domain-containing protein